MFRRGRRRWVVIMTEQQQGAYRLDREEGDAWWFLFHRMNVKVSGRETGGALTLIEWTAPAGAGPPRHLHEREDEMFWVLDGELRAVCGDAQWELSPGAMVFLPRRKEHGFLALTDCRVIQLTTPAGFESFVAEGGRRPDGPGLPPPEPPDPERLTELASRHGIVISGPPISL
jgi:quercetin dioxygenase-like cupin family protein